jgi:hypothetical protein
LDTVALMLPWPSVLAPLAVRATLLLLLVQA